MRILVTNDDGYHAPGLAVLEEIAAHFSDDVWVCAPSEEQSGAGHSLTLNRPVRLQEFGERRFAVTGTPTDAVMMALREVLDEPPDLVLSGVNRGANLGDDITYSGTVSAAIEGALSGVRAIALSQVYSGETRGTDSEFAAARHWGPKVIEPLLDAPFAERTLVNVNFPPRAPGDVRGIRVARQGFHDYKRGTVVEGRDPRGLRYFWFGLDPIEHTLDHGTDLEAIDDGYVSVTPLQLDFTHYPTIGNLAERFGD
ncbi:MAG: 5'/3'-nucleotidase SurE [Erythrobacter sp.]|uniref:5'/3'-nucleotidase SurE n=1 Tax=Erythrobacter sp. HL-111 TaxID=1798193 RepID=UPI0006DA9086|nr:5'/3'-nucleotidase SurE [Erythrobacter sp. HL-111]KPP91207.1 MAG: 5'/3'-nucleotidase SurE [Erythrobacteraceae bacterium HL-111]SDT05662.1 5'-nucleotidase /3'-nucleotidase /exopolyphosphatase [Erythrobacter sp. HL-111]